MAAKPTRRKGWELFAHPAQQNQRRYQALRAYLYEGASLGQAAVRFGYTPATLESLARDLRAGKLVLFAPAGKPGRKRAPKKDRARARVIQLRREGLSVYQISTRLAMEGIGLNRTGVGQILAEEGFGRLLRDPAEQASTSPGHLRPRHPVGYVNAFTQLTGVPTGESEPIASRHLPPVATAAAPRPP